MKFGCNPTQWQQLQRERGKRAGEHTLRRLIIAKDVYEMGSDVDGDCDVGSQKKNTHTHIQQFVM